MGAVFGMLAGFYYWIGKITGYQYDEVLGKVHFWTLFIGVNVTFFVQHFLGLAGMPRRIPDYPDTYFFWNLISSYGSIISLVASIVFFYVVYRMFVDAKPVPGAQWQIKEFFGQELEKSNTLEWELTSPPVLHTYNQLPCVIQPTK